MAILAVTWLGLLPYDGYMTFRSEVPATTTSTIHSFLLGGVPEVAASGVDD